MKVAYLEFEVDDNFQKGQCKRCPLAHFNDELGLVCPMYLHASECEIMVKKGSEKNGKQNKN